MIALRGLVAGAFGLLGAFLPLILKTPAGLSPAASGITLSIAGLFWAAGSNIASRRYVQAHSTELRRSRIGLALIGVSGTGVLAYLRDTARTP
ncbi:hypothetical protein EU513_08805 [Yimella sp. RIT 621]|uniref:hypothetical protein n=1 Tax=Yimella TaxID=908935 RepID=UPI00101D5D59|nr:MULTISPECIES: hypothetical protein [Yimella]RYG77400.1 hypothetical protein EU513_08805 [Yimella sp. RIT 621]